MEISVEYESFDQLSRRSHLLLNFRFHRCDIGDPQGSMDDGYGQYNLRRGVRNSSSTVRETGDKFK